MNIKEKWIILMCPDDPLAAKEFITSKELSKLPVCLVKRPLVKNKFASWFGNYFKKLHIQFTSNMSTEVNAKINNETDIKTDNAQSTVIYCFAEQLMQNSLCLFITIIQSIQL